MTTASSGGALMTSRASLTKASSICCSTLSSNTNLTITSVLNNERQLGQQRRNLSFFSNLFGIEKKRLEKPTPAKEEQAKVEPVKAEERKTPKPKPSKAQTGIKTKKSLSLQEERIIGGNYPARGPRIPEKRLREWSHTVENLTVVPKKLNLVAKLIRKLPVPEARMQLRFSNKAISRDVLLALDQACMKARAEGNIHVKDLIVGQCYVGGKIIGHKMDIKARGKSGRITKKVSHLNVILYENPELVKGFKSKTLLPKQYEKEQKAEYIKRTEEKAKAEKGQTGVFRVIA